MTKEKEDKKDYFNLTLCSCQENLKKKVSRLINV